MGGRVLGQVDQVTHGRLEEVQLGLQQLGQSSSHDLKGNREMSPMGSSVGHGENREELTEVWSPASSEVCSRGAHWL